MSHAEGSPTVHTFRLQKLVRSALLRHGCPRATCHRKKTTVTWHVCGLTRAGFLDALDMVTPLCMIRWHAHRSGRSQCAGGNGSSLAAALQRTPGTHRRSGRLRWPWMREAVRPRRCKMAVVTRAGPKRRGGGRLVPAPASRASQQRDG